MKNNPLRDIETLAGFNNLLVLFLLATTVFAVVYRDSIAKNIFLKIYREFLILRSEIFNHYYSSILFIFILNLLLFIIVILLFNDSISSQHNVYQSRCGEMTNEHSFPAQMIAGGFQLGITFSIFWGYLYLSYF